MPTKKAAKPMAIDWQKSVSELKKLGGQMNKEVKNLKKRYDRADHETKKKIMAGLAGAAALIAGALIVKKAAGKKKK